MKTIKEMENNEEDKREMELIVQEIGGETELQTERHHPMLLASLQDPTSWNRYRFL